MQNTYCSIIQHCVQLKSRGDVYFCSILFVNVDPHASFVARILIRSLIVSLSNQIFRTLVREQTQSSVGSLTAMVLTAIWLQSGLEILFR